MKNTFFILFMLFVFILTGCSNQSSKPVIDSTQESQENQVLNDENHKGELQDDTSEEHADTSNSEEELNRLGSAKADDYFIEEVIRNYEELFPIAINENDFSYIEKLLINESKLYNSQKKLIGDLYDRGVREKLIDFEMKQIVPTEKKDEYKVYVKENILIHYPDKGETEKEYHWVYTVIQDEDVLGLSDIAELDEKLRHRFGFWKTKELKHENDSYAETTGTITIREDGSLVGKAYSDRVVNGYLSRNADIEFTGVVKEKDELICSFENDGWDHKGFIKLELQDDRIIGTIKITEDPEPPLNWSIQETTIEFYHE